MYTLGQTFDGKYPPEAAEFCNENGTMHIERISVDNDGISHYKIVLNDEPTEEEKAQAKLFEETNIEARISALEDALAELMEG